MLTASDLEAYLARIGYTGPRTPNHEALAEILRCQVATIPFENLDVLLGRPIRTDAASVAQKLVHAHRGGYCFEQNHLLLYALRALGFIAEPMIARVRWQVPAEIATGLTHMLVRVALDGRDWLVDAGMGSLSLTAPLAMTEGLEQETPHDRRRLVRCGALFAHQVFFADTWQDVSLFHPQTAAAIDLEMGNWYSHTHPQAHFRNNLMVARATADGRCTLFNREFTLRDRNGQSQKHELQTPEELLVHLANHFGLHFPAGTRFGQAPVSWPV
ncbi:MAG TPA: arylamine N-acetyltransferase [Lacunisphaera sp.]|nr:arylamine N-acetyltransferase [Lacunisphaera sp.]